MSKNSSTVGSVARLLATLLVFLCLIAFPTSRAEAQNCNVSAGCNLIGMTIVCVPHLTAEGAQCNFTSVTTNAYNVSACMGSNFGNRIDIVARVKTTSTGLAFCQVNGMGTWMSFSGMGTALPCAGSCGIDGPNDGLPVELLTFGVK